MKTISSSAQPRAFASYIDIGRGLISWGRLPACPEPSRGGKVVSKLPRSPGLAVNIGSDSAAEVAIAEEREEAIIARSFVREQIISQKPRHLATSQKCRSA